MKRFEFMIRGAITALAALATSAIFGAANAQSVIVNSAPGTAAFTSVCTSAPALSMDPAGNLVITCAPVSSGGTLLAPVCSVPTVSIAVGSSATVSASCTGGAIATYAWTNNNAAPGFPSPTTASFTVGPFPTAGSYMFTLTAANTAGSSNPTGTVVVNAASTPPPPTGCATAAVNAVFTGGFGTDRPAIPVGGYASYSLPQFTAATNKYQIFTAVESNSSVSGLPIEYTVSPCVGDFTSMPAICEAFGTANSGISLYAFEGDTPTTLGAATAAGPGVCVMQPNTQYYLNVRTAKLNGTNSCTTGTCYLYVQYHLYSY